MAEKWQVIYYVSPNGEIPVRDFLNSCSSTTKAKALRLFCNIDEYGIQLVIPHIKKLTGTPLWEIRILGKDNIRIIYITEIRRQVLLLHGFFKKKQKTPRKEINIALKRLKEYSS